MANVNAPFGLRPLRKLGGGNISQSVYGIATDYATAIYDGDIVKLAATSRNVEKAAADTTNAIGVFKGCSYVDSTGKNVFSHHWPGVSDGKTNIQAFVVDDPHVIFECQADACAASEIGVLGDWNVGTGNTITGMSGLYATVTGVTATTGEPLRVLRLVEREGNDYGAYAKIEVMFAEHAYLSIAAGAGGTN